MTTLSGSSTASQPDGACRGARSGSIGSPHLTSVGGAAGCQYVGGTPAHTVGVVVKWGGTHTQEQQQQQQHAAPPKKTRAAATAWGTQAASVTSMSWHTERSCWHTLAPCAVAAARAPAQMPSCPCRQRAFDPWRARAQPAVPPLPPASTNRSGADASCPQAPLGQWKRPARPRALRSRSAAQQLAVWGGGGGSGEGARVPGTPGHCVVVAGNDGWIGLRAQAQSWMGQLNEAGRGSPSARVAA